MGLESLSEAARLVEVIAGLLDLPIAYHAAISLIPGNAVLAAEVRASKGRARSPSMLMLDAQTASGARYGPTFHQPDGRGGPTSGTKRTIAVEIEGLPVAIGVASARPHDVAEGRALLGQHLDQFPRPSWPSWPTGVTVV